MNRQGLFFLLGVVFIIGVLHLMGQFLYLYWQLPMYDRVVHFLGGFFTGSAVYLFLRPWWQTHSAVSLMISTLVLSLVVGILWEVFEAKTGVTIMTDIGYIIDTREDIILDIVGSLVAWLFVPKQFPYPHESKS